MTETEWQACDEWRPMLEFLYGRWSNRKAILCLCAGMRTIWDLLVNDESQHAVEVAECKAEGTASEVDVSLAQYSSEPLFEGLNTRRLYSAASIPYFTVGIENGEVTENLVQHLSDLKEWPGTWLIREIAGNPFRSLSISSSILLWNEGIIPRLAQVAYDDRILPAGTLDHTRLLILADALEEAGCTDEQILTHLRGSGEHYRGCWVIDLLLGKE